MGTATRVSGRSAFRSPDARLDAIEAALGQLEAWAGRLIDDPDDLVKAARMPAMARLNTAGAMAFTVETARRAVRELRAEQAH